MINKLKTILPGIILAMIIAGFSTLLEKKVPLIGAAVFAIIIGIIFNSTLGKPKATISGLRITSKVILKLAIILLGTGLNIYQIISVGSQSLYIMIFTLSSAFLTSAIFGRIMGVNFNLRNLIAAGTGICGGSAIVTLSPIMGADDKDIAFAISATFIFDIIAVVLFPIIGRTLGLSDAGYGLWAGTAVNDTSSVVAAGFAFSEAAGNYATIVKLTRTLSIIPVSLIFTGIITIQKKKEGKNNEINTSFKKVFPWFLLGFIAAAIINSAGYISANWQNIIQHIAKFLIAMALASIGLNTNLRDLKKSGITSLILGFIVSLTVVIVSLTVQYFTKLT